MATVHPNQQAYDQRIAAMLAAERVQKQHLIAPDRDRGASAAKQIDPLPGDHALNQTANVQQSFERAHDARGIERTPANDRAADSGSSMVKNERPQPELKPQGPERDAVDAKTFNRDWSAEQTRANAYNAKVAEMARDGKLDQQPQQAPQQAPQHQRGLSPGM